MRSDKSEEQNPCYSASVQKQLKKLISEEWLAGNMYKLFAAAGKTEDDKRAICGIFSDIADDELNDHMRSLIKVAENNGFEVPQSYSEIVKCASDEDSKVFQSFKPRQDAEYYMSLAKDSEVRAIKSYEEALNDKNLSLCPEAESVLLNNYYDEIEHLRIIQFNRSALEAFKSI